MKIFKFERDDEKGAIILKRDVALAVTKNLRKRFKSINSAKRYLESYGYRTVRTARNPSVRERNNQVGKIRKTKLVHRLGNINEWWVVIEHNYARRTNRVVDYSTRKGDMLDSVMRKIDAYAFDTNDSDLIKRIDRSKSAEDFLEKNASKYSWGYNTDIYGDNGWEIIRLTKDNLDEMGEQYSDIYDRFSEEDFE